MNSENFNPNEENLFSLAIEMGLLVLTDSSIEVKGPNSTVPSKPIQVPQLT